MLRTTHTTVNLGLSQAAHDEIRKKLEDASYHHCIDKDGRIDMTGISVVVEGNEEA